MYVTVGIWNFGAAHHLTESIPTGQKCVNERRSCLCSLRQSSITRAL